MSLGRGLALARHQVRILLADRSVLVTLVFMPLAMMAFFKPIARLAVSNSYPGSNGAGFAVPGITTMFAFFAVAFLGFNFFLEHRWNTWERLRASQATNAEIMFGKVVPVLLLSLIQQGVLFASGCVLFGMRITGSILGLAAVALCLSLSLTALGVLLAAVVRTEQQMNVFANLGTVVLAGVSGAMVPVEILPGWVRHLAPLTPQYWAIRGFRSVILDGGGLASVALPVAFLGGVAALTAGLALLRFRFDDAKPMVS